MSNYFKNIETIANCGGNFATTEMERMEDEAREQRHREERLEEDIPHCPGCRCLVKHDGEYCTECQIAKAEYEEER